MITDNYILESVYNTDMTTTNKNGISAEKGETKYYCPECKEYQGTWKKFGFYIDETINIDGRSRYEQVCVGCYNKWNSKRIHMLVDLDVI